MKILGFENCEWGKGVLIRTLREHLFELTKHDSMDAEFYMHMTIIQNLASMLKWMGNQVKFYQREDWSDVIYRMEINDQTVYESYPDTPKEE